MLQASCGTSTGYRRQRGVRPGEEEQRTGPRDVGRHCGSQGLRSNADNREEGLSLQLTGRLEAAWISACEKQSGEEGSGTATQGQFGRSKADRWVAGLQLPHTGQ